MARLIQRLFGRGAASSAGVLLPGAVACPIGAAPTLDATARSTAGQALLLLGIDFGTAFTKIVWRQWPGTRMGVAAIGPGGDSMAPSVVWVTGEGGLHLKDPGGAKPERFLKMRLASADPADGTPDDLAAMSVFFVGEALRAGFVAARAAFRGADVALYGVAIGCPAQFCDDGRIEAFERVAAQAWRWAHDGSAPRTLGELRTWMQSAPDAATAQLSQARAEVAAAVDCFVMRPDAGEGRYLFLDVGAGTLDGACFKLYRENKRTKVTVLSSAVTPLGVEMATRDAARQSGASREDLARQIFGKGPFDDGIWRPVRSRIGAFVGDLLMKAKKVDCVADWLAAADGRAAVWRSLEDQVDVAYRLPVFFGGGGMTSPLYRIAVRRAGEGLAGNFGVPGLALGELEPPPGFEGAADAPFHRFAVAYGLTRPFTDAPPWILPSQISPSAPSIPRNPTRPGPTDYGDSKDVYG